MGLGLCANVRYDAGRRTLRRHEVEHQTRLAPRPRSRCVMVAPHPGQRPAGALYLRLKTSHAMTGGYR